MGKLVVFKRISATPLPPPKQIVVPPDPGEAYFAGLEMGKNLLKEMKRAQDQGVTYEPVPLKPVKTPPPPTMPTSATTELFKESDTGIGFKRWACWLEWTNRWTVWTEWGHENKHQARKQMAFAGESRARAYMQSCIAAKLKKGYRRHK